MISASETQRTILEAVSPVRRLFQYVVRYRSKFLIDNLDFHFSKDHLLLVTVNTTGSFNTSVESIALLERATSRLGAIPGVLAVSYSRFRC